MLCRYSGVFQKSTIFQHLFVKKLNKPNIMHPKSFQYAIITNANISSLFADFIKKSLFCGMWEYTRKFTHLRDADIPLYSTFMRVQAEICKRTGQNIRPYSGLFFFQVRIFFNGYNFNYESKIRTVNSNFQLTTCNL